MKNWSNGNQFYHKRCTFIHLLLDRWLIWSECFIWPISMHVSRSSSNPGVLLTNHSNLYVLLYRPIFLQNPNTSMNPKGNLALDAATRSTRILEDMLSENLVQHGLVHLWVLNLTPEPLQYCIRPKITTDQHSSITHTFSALCLHTIHFGRVTGTARKLAEHRAKLCLLGLKELQKSWDLENWVLDLFFRCLDDRMAKNLRLAEGGLPSTLSSDTTKGSPIPDSPSMNMPCGSSVQPLSPASNEILSNTQAPLLNQSEEAAINMDWYELFNTEGEDVMGLAGSLTNPDYLNPQNLEFLYRFLWFWDKSCNVQDQESYSIKRVRLWLIQPRLAGH